MEWKLLRFVKKKKTCFPHLLRSGRSPCSVERQQTEGSRTPPSSDTWRQESVGESRAHPPQQKLLSGSRHLRNNGVGGDDVLHLLGPGVHEAEPSAPQRDEGAVFDFELVTVGVDLLPHLQHCGQAERGALQRGCSSAVSSCSKTLTLSVTLGQVVDVVLVEVLVEGGSKQLLRQVSQDGCGSGGGNGKASKQRTFKQVFTFFDLLSF